jgi:replication-associated recombination protein RarA
MSKSLILHQQTKAAIDSFVSRPSHALLLLGGQGSGKLTVAQYVASRVLGIEMSKLLAHSYVAQVRSEGVLSIEHIRDIHKLLQLKTAGSTPIRRVIIIENSHTMTSEAQNALLKHLEEPPQDTVFILTSADSHMMLTTILSRVQTINIQSPTRQQVEDVFTAATKDFDNLYELSGGNIGLLTELLEGNGHALHAHIVTAKQLLAHKPYERLTHLNEYAVDKSTALNFVNTLVRMSLLALQKVDEVRRLRPWLRVLRESYLAETRLKAAVNTKLVMTDLFLNL